MSKQKHDGDVPVSYTNRKGKTYYLHSVVRKSGKAGFAMKTFPGGALTVLPEGYAISESVNGVVSVGKLKERLITEFEEALAARKLVSLGLKYYRVEVKGKYLTIFEPIRSEGDVEDILSRLGMFLGHGPARDIENEMAKSPLWPVLRFTLVDTKQRSFNVERMTYSGDGGWGFIAFEESLRKVLDTYLPHLGKDSFFEMDML